MGIFLLSAALAAEPAEPSRDIPIPPAAEERRELAEEERRELPEEERRDPSEEERRELAEEERREEGAGLYLRALEAWQAGRWSRAHELSTLALTLDPDLSPARLLAGYALLRLRRVDEAEATLAGLSLEPEGSSLPASRMQEAERLLRRKVTPRRRDQWALSIGNVTFVQRMGDLAIPLNGYVFAARAPLWERLAVRIDGGAPWGGTANDLDIRGPRFGLYAVTAQPLGRGRWHVDLAAGPALWIAEGRYWPDGWEPYVGARAAVGLDVRLGTAIGLRYEMGASVFPAASDDFSFYAEPLDFRLALETWFGR